MSFRFAGLEMGFLSTSLLTLVGQVRGWLNRSPAPSPLVTSVRTEQPRRRRHPNQHQPSLWSVKSSDPRRKMWCGPVVVAAIIGVDVAAVSEVIKGHRNGRPVKSTFANELQLAFRHFGYEMTLLADLRCKPPTLAAWERQRTDLEAAYVVMVTGHWVAVRGKWFCDTFTRGVPVRIKDAPRRRKRVQFVYQITVVRS
jgi:hypothetical protein